MVDKAPRLERVLETAIYSSDMEASRRFYEEVLGLTPMFADGRLTAYDAGQGTVFLIFLQGASEEAVSLPGGTIPGHSAGGHIHFAFAVADGALDLWEKWLLHRGIEIEARMSWPGGGKSLYFRDPSGHLAELATPGLWPSF
jgi:catechol 2,3-dioxygenase-like lactoylglutathione lyase family enzyme